MVRVTTIFCVIAVLCGVQTAQASDCPFFFSSHVKRADVILVGELDVQEYVGYARAKLREGEKDEYAAARSETPLYKWKINRFKIIESYKGDPGEKSKFTTVVSPRYFTRGEQYVIFARKASKVERYNRTGAEYVNEGCDKTEYIADGRGSSLLEDVQDEFGVEATGFPHN